MNEKIKQIAEFDGWVYESEEWDMMYKLSDGFWCNDAEIYENIHPSDEDLETMYLSDLNALHQVIKKIRSEFQNNIEPIEDARNAYERLGNAIYDAFDSDSFTDLVEAVYYAIVYIKTYKNGTIN